MVSMEGGIDLFLKVMKDNLFDDCVMAAKNAKLGIDAMIRSSQTVKLTASGKKVVQKNMLGHIESQKDITGGHDPLGDHRQRLTRGNVFAHWGEGGQRFVSINRDITVRFLICFLFNPTAADKYAWMLNQLR